MLIGCVSGDELPVFCFLKLCYKYKNDLHKREMNFKFPKNDGKYHWTNHVMGKMAFYGLSPERIKRIIRNPARSEKGVAPDTIAVMQPNKILSSIRGKPSTWKEEVWTMYATAKPQKISLKPVPLQAGGFASGFKSLKSKVQSFGRKIIITAWRYPGKSPVREAVPIPAEILAELREEGVIE